MKFILALIAAVATKHHHHHHDTQPFETMEAYEHMNEEQLLMSLEKKLSFAQQAEARGDGDAAVAKTAAIKNIQKALTARILKRFDDGQPLVEVARKIKVIEGMTWKKDSESCNLWSQSLKMP